MTPRRVKLAYGPARSQFGHLHVPAADPDGFDARLRPVVLVHGGSWSTDFSLVVYSAIARDLVGRGALVWNLEYRRVEEGGLWPIPGEDVRDGIRALDGVVRTELGARHHDVAWDDVAVVGHSAGAQLAVWAVAALGARTGRTRITQVVAQAGPLDMQARGRAGSETAARLLGSHDPAVVADLYRDVSPATQRTFGAHVVAIHGTADAVVPARMSESYVERVTARGQSAAFVPVGGAGHDDFVEPASGAHRATLRALGL